jgi:hypothetical protein
MKSSGINNIQGSPLSLPSSSHHEQCAHGICHPSTPANHPTHIFLGYLKSQFDGGTPSSLADPHLSGIIDQGSSNEFNQFLHSLPPDINWRVR